MIVFAYAMQGFWIAYSPLKKAKIRTGLLRFKRSLAIHMESIFNKNSGRLKPPFFFAGKYLISISHRPAAGRFEQLASSLRQSSARHQSLGGPV